MYIIRLNTQTKPLYITAGRCVANKKYALRFPKVGDAHKAMQAKQRAHPYMASMEVVKV